jgi:ankyrin repeat protein
VSQKDFKRAKDLVDENERRRPHTTFLMQACDTKNKVIVDFLLNSGAAVDKTGFMEWTALMCTARVGDEDIFELLLKHNADVMKKDSVSSFEKLLINLCVYTWIGVCFFPISIAVSLV